MKKQYNDRPIYDNDLKQLDKDIMSNRKQKSQTRSNLLWKIDSIKQPFKKLGRLKYVASLGVFMILIFMGYQLFTNGMWSSNEQAFTTPQDNQSEHILVLDDDDADESEEREKISESSLGDRAERITPSVDINSILPSYVPGMEQAEPENVVEETVGPAYADYYHSDSHSFRVNLAESDVSIEDAIQGFKNYYKYKEETFEKIEIAGYPSILRLEGEDIAYYSDLHIITENYIITLSTRGIEKKDILKSANSMDFSGL